MHRRNASKGNGGLEGAKVPFCPAMPRVANPNRSPTFRLITIASSGLGSFVIGMWGLHLAFGESIAGMPTNTVGGIVAGLCALAAALASLSFFAGVDESAAYLRQETHF